MYTSEELKEAIEDHQQAAADALRAVQLGGTGGTLVAEGLDAMAAACGIDRAEYWLMILNHHHLNETFALALAARGAPLDLESIELTSTHIAPEKAAQFANRARQIRCRIWKSGLSVGSGVLVGPSTVLTAWHVINSGPGYAPDELPTDVEVELTDGRRFPAIVRDASPCSQCEFENLMPANDNAVADLHDIAILKLSEPVGAGLHFADIAKPPIAYKRPSPIFLLHFPAGEDAGIGEGTTAKIRTLSARVGHSVETDGGSSGGGCFDTRRMLVGVHQGKQPKHEARGRFVPIERFIDKLIAVVEADITPPYLWSLDGTPNSQIVIARDRIALAYAEAMRGGAIRGVHVRRMDANGDAAPLAFSYEILAALIARDPGTRLVRISFEELTDDIPGAIVRRVNEAGLVADQIEVRRGVADGESAPEAVGADRGRQAADRASQAAAQAGVTLWLFVDHPAVAFGDEQRAALEGFIDRALRREELRLAITGYEAAAIPGRRYENAIQPDAAFPGLMTEYLGTFRRDDVERLLNHAASDAGYDLSANQRGLIVNAALANIPNTNGFYSIADSVSVGERLATSIQDFFAPQSAGAPNG